MLHRIALLLFFAASASASTMEPLDLTKINGQSSLIIIGYVTSVRVMPQSPGLHEEIATVRVTSVLKGSYGPKTLQIRMRSGFISFDRFLKRGDSGVFFLVRTEDQRFEAAYPRAFALFERDVVKTP